MGTKLAIVSNNLVVADKEVQMFALLPQLYPQVFIDFFIYNYFQLLDNAFHKWLDNFDIESFHSMTNNLDPELKFIFENSSKPLNFLDNSWKQNFFDIHYKPTHSII